MTSPRVAVIGGGPAGSSTVLHLLKLGVSPSDIVIFDRAEFPRPKLCGGALTFRGTEALAELVGHLPGGGETRTLEFRSRLGRYEVKEPGPQWLYDRAHLDHLLLSSCIDAGVEVRTGLRVDRLQPSGSGWTLTTRLGDETFPWVIGADGAAGIARRASGLRGGHQGRLVEAVYEPEPGNTEFREDWLYFDFDPIFDGIPGYGWLFPYPSPKQDGLWKLGIMDGRGEIPGEKLRAWTEGLAERSGFRLVDRKLSGWPEHYYHPRAQAHRPGLILTGEAYGIDPLLGEGIAPSLEMARYAAKRLKEALDAGVESIPGYERGFRKTTEGRNLWFQSKLANRLYGPNPERWLKVMFGVPYLHELAASGEQAYGRLRKHMASMTWALVVHNVFGGRSRHVTGTT